MLCLCLALCARANVNVLCQDSECMQICNEQHCVFVDVCQEKTSNNVSAPSNTWLWRNSSALRTPPESFFLAGSLTVDRAYNFFAVSSLYIPLHIEVQICEPSFHNALFDCYDPSIQVLSYDVARWVNIAQNRTQLIKYRLKNNATCSDVQSVEKGFFLDRIIKPSVLKNCTAKPLHSVWKECLEGMIECCDFECNIDYIKQTSSRQCTHKCVEALKDSCASHEFALTTCNTSAGTKYHCQNCSLLAGFESIVSSDVHVCEYRKCENNFYSSGHKCLPCPDNFWSNAGSTQCQHCALGKQRSSEQPTCTDCFEQAPSSTACAMNTQYPSTNLSRVTQYLEQTILNHDKRREIMYDACQKRYACIGCEPGHYLSSGTCLECAHNTYQPNFDSTRCFACSATRGTLRTGSVSAENCLCAPGFE